MSKKLEKPEEVKDDVSLGDILSGANVAGIVREKADNEGMKGQVKYGMIGTRIVEAAVCIATKRRAIDLLKKERVKSLNAEEKKIAEETWIAVVGENDLKDAATMQAKDLKNRLRNTTMSAEEWKDQTVTIRGQKVPVAVYSADGKGGYSAPDPKRASGYGAIYESKLSVIKENYEVPLEEPIKGVALIELSGLFERFRPKKKK